MTGAAYPKHRPVRDELYKAHVRKLACVLSYLGTCEGANVPHHAGEDGGTGLKASDTDLIPICHGHHDALHICCGYFRIFGEDGIGKLLRHAWEQMHATKTRVEYERAVPW